MLTIEFKTDTKKYQLTKYKVEKLYSYEDTLEKISMAAIQEGVSQEQLTMAYENMAKNKHLKASFGVNNLFLYSE